MVRGSLIALAVAALTAALPCGGALPLQQQEPRDLLESLRRIILEGDEALGIPVLDPFTLDYVNGSNGNAEGELIDLVVKGLAGFVGDVNVSFTIGLGGIKLNAVIDVTVPQLTAAAEYAFDSVLQINGGDSHLFGAGTVQADLEDLSVRANIGIRNGLFGIQLQNLDIELGVAGFEAHFKGLLGGGLVDDFLSAVLSELAMELFQEQRPVLEEALEDALSTRLEAALAEYTFSDLLCLLLGSCNEEDNLSQIYH